jgi:predicted ATPase
VLAPAAPTLWQLGYPDQALQRANEAIALAQSLSHPFTLALALVWAGFVAQFRREISALQVNAEGLTALSTEYGMTNYLSFATLERGLVMVAQGLHEEAIVLIQESRAACRATGMEMHQPNSLCMLAEAFLEAGRFDEGLSAVTEALAAADKTEERFYEAETHRLKGELLLRRQAERSGAEQPSLRNESGIDHSNVAEARSCFERAIEIARKQSAKSWELRATTGLARLLACQGRRDEARTMLTDIHNWFTEGFGTADLKDAKALLDELDPRHELFS